jgi:hypothetical protein
MTKMKQLLNYLATHPDATVRFHTSNMILNIHLDALYLLEANAHSQACGAFFMGWRADPTKPIKLNDVSHLERYCTDVLLACLTKVRC